MPRGGGEQMLGWRSWNLLFFLPNDLADIFDGETVLGVVEGGV